MEVKKNTATCVDQGDGTYRLRWFSPQPGHFSVYAKIDGLHVIGSPARIQFIEAPKLQPNQKRRGSAGSVLTKAEHAVLATTKSKESKSKRRLSKEIK